MTETLSDVYDLTFPSPISLKEISSIVVAVELWRKEIFAHLESKRLLHEFDLKHNIQLKDVLPSLPSTIYSLLEEYVDTFRKSIMEWQNMFRCRNLFSHNGSTNVLSRFYDFAWDWDGRIHGGRTAKRMMSCNRLTEDEKFQIACLYCLEDDIKQIWPSVSETKDLNEIDFETCPEQYYWICNLRNELHKVPDPIQFDSIELSMIHKLGTLEYEWKNFSAVMYFCNRLPSDNLAPIDFDILYSILNWPAFFARFILPKLNEPQLDTFMAENHDVYIFMMFLLRYESTLVHVVPAWMYIRSRIDIECFRYVIRGLLSGETYHDAVRFRPKKAANSFRELWESAPHHFKRSVLDYVLHDDRMYRIEDITPRISYKGMKFLITVLQDAAFEERNAFWRKNWRNLIHIAPVEDLVFMMNLCFRNENEITLFKENVMSIYENIVEGCALLLKYGEFEEFNDFMSFCCLDEQTRKELKRRLLRSSYVEVDGENVIRVMTAELVGKYKLLNEFIDDVFQDAADLGAEFRDQLRSSPGTENGLFHCILGGYFVFVMEFVGTFFPNEQVVAPLKARLFECFKQNLNYGVIHNLDGDIVQVFLIWLLGSEDEVIRYKQSIPIEESFSAMMRYEWRAKLRFVGDPKPEFPENVDRFLMWYFNNDEVEIDKFTKLDEFESFAPRIRRTIM